MQLGDLWIDKFGQTNTIMVTSSTQFYQENWLHDVWFTVKSTRKWMRLTHRIYVDKNYQNLQ